MGSRSHPYRIVSLTITVTITHTHTHTLTHTHTTANQPFHSYCTILYCHSTRVRHSWGCFVCFRCLRVCCPCPLNGQQLRCDRPAQECECVPSSTHLPLYTHIHSKYHPTHHRSSPPRDVMGQYFRRDDPVPPHQQNDGQSDSRLKHPRRLR